jgi:hypothetical protein
MEKMYADEEMSNKWKEFNNFLDAIDIKYEQELKEKKGIRNYVAYGTGKNDVTYNFDSRLSESIQNEILQKLLELFPRQQHNK